jgi:hypothetical protein
MARLTQKEIDDFLNGGDTSSSSMSQDEINAFLGNNSAPIATPQQQANQLDMQEAANRPRLTQFLGDAISGGAGDIASVGELGYKAIDTILPPARQFIVDAFKEPKKTEAKIKTFASGLKSAITNSTPEQMYETIKGLAGDVAGVVAGTLQSTGESFGIDLTRPGPITNKVDIDTLINKWQHHPVAAIGDIYNVKKMGELLVSKTLSRGAKNAAEESIIQSIKKNGPALEEMSTALTPDEAFNAGREAGASEVKSIAGESPFQKLLTHQKTIRSLPNARAQLNDPNFAKRTSSGLTSDVLQISNEENLKLKKLVSKVKDVTVPINADLIEAKSAAGTAYEADFDANVQQYLGDTSAGISIEKARKAIGEIDDSIYKGSYVYTPEKLKSLAYLRATVRKVLGENVPGYDDQASFISDRLSAIGSLESKAIKASKAGESIDSIRQSGSLGLKLVDTPEAQKLFQDTMLAAKDSGGKTAVLAGKAYEKANYLAAFKAWNEFTGGEALGRFRGVSNMVPSVIMKPAIDVGTMAALNPGVQAAASAVGTTVKAIPSILKGTAQASSITQGLDQYLQENNRLR